MDAITSMISIMQLVGVIAIIISLAILIYRLIIYKENGNKRATFMDGFTKLLIGIIIIGSLGLIVNVVYGYLYSLMHYNGSLIANTTGGIHASNFNSESLNTMLKGADDISFGLLGDIFAVFLSGIAKFVYNLFDLQSISQLITPAHNHVYVFTATGWHLLAKAYTIMTIPTIALLAFMMFVTGIKFLRASINPQEASVAKEDMLRWLFTVLLIAGGFLLCKGSVIAGNVLAEILNQSVQGLMPHFDFKSFINGKDMGFDGAVMSAYLVYITFKVNVLFMIRDFMLGGFIVFAPLAFAMWGINKNINAFAIWLGEMLSNAFMVFFFSLSFLVFAILLYWSKSASNMNTLLFMLVGLAMILKLASVFRNSVQGWMTRMSGVNEDDISRKVSAGGMLGAVASYGKNMRNARSGVSEMFNTAKAVAKPVRHPVNTAANAVNGVKTGVGAVKDSAISALSDVNDTRKATGATAKKAFGKQSEGSGLKDHFNTGRNEILGTKVGSAMDEMKDNAIKNGHHFDMDQKLDDKGNETPISKVGGVNEKGEYEALNDNAIRYSFLKGIQSNATGEKTKGNSVLANTKNSASNTIDSIKEAIVQDQQLQGKTITDEEAGNQALTKFSQAMGLNEPPKDGEYGEKKEALLKDSKLKGFARGNIDSIVADSRNMTAEKSQASKGIKSNEVIAKAKDNYDLQKADFSNMQDSEDSKRDNDNPPVNQNLQNNSVEEVGANATIDEKKADTDEINSGTTSVIQGQSATTQVNETSEEKTTPIIATSKNVATQEVGTSNENNNSSTEEGTPIVTTSKNVSTQEVGTSNGKKIDTEEKKSSTTSVERESNSATSPHTENIVSTSKPIIDKTLNVNENIETFSKQQKESADMSEKLIGKNPKTKSNKK